MELLAIAREYENLNVRTAIIGIADSLAGFGLIDGEHCAPNEYCILRSLIKMEYDGTTENNRFEGRRFISIDEYVKGLNAHGIDKNITVQEMLLNLEAIGFITLDDEDHSEVSSICITAQDKGYVKMEDDKVYISTKGLAIYNLNPF